MNVENLMTRSPRTCTTGDMLHRAVQLMWDHDFGAVPVVDGNGRLAGIVTDRDACMAGLTQGRALHEIPVEQVMSRMLFTLAPHDPVQNAIDLFEERQVRRIPVIDGRGTLVGILSMADLVCATCDGKVGKHTRSDEVLSAVGAVSRPRKDAALPDAAEVEARGTLFPQPAATRAAKGSRPKGSRRAAAKGSKRK